MAGDMQIGDLDPERIKDYAAATGKIAQAVESLTRHDGWLIFMALYQREKNRIKEQSNYSTLEDFKADRRAIEIVEAILDEFQGYISDAQGAGDMLAGLSPETAGKDRGIMLIEAAEGGTIEG